MAQRMQKKIITRKLVITFLIIAAGAVFLTWFLEYRYFQSDAGRAFSLVFERPRVFFYNAFLVLLFSLLILMLFRKPFISLATTWVLIIIVAYINANKFVARGTPLLPEDLQMAGQAGALAKFIDIWSLARMIIACGLAIGLGIFFDRKVYSRLEIELPERLPWWLRRMAIPRFMMAGILIGLMVIATDFARNHAGIAYERVEWLDTTFTAWNQNRNYDENGFIVGFLYNMNRLALEEPEGYSEEEIGEIYAKYDEKREEAEESGSLSSLAEADYNIVVILNESFYDPEVLKDYYDFTGGDPAPTWHKIQKNYPSGYMYSTEYGGGTANVEFEVFTGLTNYWAGTVPFTDIFPRLKTVPSIANFAKSAGYKTVALHPYVGGMYKRDLALKVEGYDDFIELSEFSYTEHDGNSQYVNDQSSYRQLVDQLKSSEEKQMVELVTMQNHLPYDGDIYTERKFKVSNVEDPEAAEDIEVYLQSLSNSDKYLAEFLNELEELDEKTVVMFFGDHSPGIFTEISANEDEEIRNLAQLTPYFIYNNFGAELGDGSASARVGRATARLPEIVGKTTLPTTTPNCLSNTLFNSLRLEKPTLYYLIDTVCAEEPILTSRYLNEREAAKTEAVEAYKQVTYDILGGEQYWIEDAEK